MLHNVAKKGVCLQVYSEKELWRGNLTLLVPDSFELSFGENLNKKLQVQNDAKFIYRLWFYITFIRSTTSFVIIKPAGHVSTCDTKNKLCCKAWFEKAKMKAEAAALA